MTDNWLTIGKSFPENYEKKRDKKKKSKGDKDY